MRTGNFVYCLVIFCLFFGFDFLNGKLVLWVETGCDVFRLFYIIWYRVALYGR